MSSTARFREREADWRVGPVVYQVLVDRFAPPADLAARRALYPAPRTLHGWDEAPARGSYLPEHGLWTHELAFWGGDLRGAATRLEHLVALGADVLYLNPIHRAWTNHKYDAEDYFAVSPEFGDRRDVGALARACHARGLRLVLDGVFNHMGRRSAWFQDALAGGARRGWFFVGPEWRLGYRAWFDVPNLPELRLEEPAVRARLWGDRDSVVQGYLREEEVDGWRLDVAFDLGPEYLRELTAAAHAARPGSLVLGEAWNYPSGWVGDVLDGVLGFTARSLILGLCQGALTGPQVARHLARLVEDTGVDGLLRCWLVLDNHDTPRLRSSLPEAWQRALAQTLQLTLPGAAQLYYGVEAGMTGGDDPEMRGPMRWEDARPGNPEFDRLAALLAVRKARRALRVGDVTLLDAERLLAFTRTTDRALEATVVLVNPTAAPVTETLLLRDPWLMNGTLLRDLVGREAAFKVESGLLTATLPARTAMVLAPDAPDTVEYSPYKRTP